MRTLTDWEVEQIVGGTQAAQTPGNTTTTTTNTRNQGVTVTGDVTPLNSSRNS